MKRTALIISYWTVALILFATVLSSTGYTLPDAFFLASSLLPVAVLFRYLLAQIRFTSRWQGIRDVCFLTLFILTMAFLAVHLAHTILLDLHRQLWHGELGVSPILLNPIFLMAMLLLIIGGDYFVGRMIEQRLPEAEESITFTSDRQPVTLQRQEILYVESCDTETWIYATDGRKYRNKRPISAWANLLGKDFLRIHRSYLVRISACQGRDGENIILGDLRLPISRKYKNEVQETLDSRL
ncbi:MAG: LytTR family transcriptional regulator [Bacteroidaceae bacterium]|nr:LytTR family transcriptional regulator [Bacteroidaceae bacterium]